MISRWNATTWRPFRSLPLWTEPEKLSFVVFREREQQSMNQFNLHAASKYNLKFLIFCSHSFKQNKIEMTELHKQEKGKREVQDFSSRLRRRPRPSCTRSPIL